MSKGRKLALAGTVSLVFIIGLLVSAYLNAPIEEKEAAAVIAIGFGTLSLPIVIITIHFWCGGDPDRTFSPGVFITDVIKTKLLI